MAKTLSSKELKSLFTGLEAQGCTIRSIKSGYTVLHPDGVQAFTMHLTLSDPRSMKNFKSLIVRSGLTWPIT